MCKGNFELWFQLRVWDQFVGCVGGAWPVAAESWYHDVCLFDLDNPRTTGLLDLLCPVRGPTATIRVRSLTQLYYVRVAFSQSRISVKSVFFTNTQPRFVSVAINGVLGHCCLAVHAWRFPYISEVPRVQGEVRFRAREWSDVSSKSFSRAQHWYEGVRRNERILSYTIISHWIALQENQWFFCNEQTEKSE